MDNSRERVYILKAREPRSKPCVTPDNKNRTQLKYHEQILTGGVVPDRIETIQVLYLTDQACLLTYTKVHYGQLY